MVFRKGIIWKFCIYFLLLSIIWKNTLAADIASLKESFFGYEYNENDFNPMFVEEFNQINISCEKSTCSQALIRLRAGQWFALRQQLEYDSMESGLKRVVGSLPINPFAGNIFSPAIKEIELADKYCEALMEMSKKGLATKFGIKIAKDPNIRHKFCSDAAELYFNGLQPRLSTAAQKELEAEELGEIEYINDDGDNKVIPLVFKAGLPLNSGGLMTQNIMTSSQEAEYIAKQTLIRNFVHIVKFLDLEAIREDPLMLREYFPGSIIQLRNALDSDDPEIVALRLLKLGSSSSILENFIQNHRGRPDKLLMQPPERKNIIRTDEARIKSEWETLISNADLSKFTGEFLQKTAEKYVALTPIILSNLKKLSSYFKKELIEGRGRYTHAISENLENLPAVLQEEIRVALELSIKGEFLRVHSLEKLKVMIKSLPPAAYVYAHFQEGNIQDLLSKTSLSKSDVAYFSRVLSKVILNLLNKISSGVISDDQADSLIIGSEPIISLQTVVEIVGNLQSDAMSALIDYVEKVVPNFVNKNQFPEATSHQKQEIETLLLAPMSSEIAKQLFREETLRPLLLNTIPNDYGLLDIFLRNLYILTAETGDTLSDFLIKEIGDENKSSNTKDKRLYIEDNIRFKSPIWISSVKNLLSKYLYPHELASRRFLQYLKEYKLGLKSVLSTSMEEIIKVASTITLPYLQKLMDNCEDIKLTDSALNQIFLGNQGNMLIRPNKKNYLIRHIFQKDAETVFEILRSEKSYEILYGLVKFLESIQKQERTKPEFELDGAYWSCEKNEWINLDKKSNSDVTIKIEPTKVTDLPLGREQEWERVAAFSKWSEFVKNLPVDSIPNGFRFSFGLYSKFIQYCQRGIREIAYRLIVRSISTTEPAGKYWEYLPQNIHSVIIKAENSKEREENVLSFCTSVYTLIYGEKGIPEQFRKTGPKSQGLESDKYEMEQNIMIPQDLAKQQVYRLDNVNEQWAFIAKEARKPGIFYAPTLPSDSSLLGDVWRNIYMEQQLVTSSEKTVEAKITVLTEMCIQAINNLKKKRNYYGDSLYKMTYDSQDSIEIFCSDVAGRWFKDWPTHISLDMLIMNSSEISKDNVKKKFTFDRQYLKKFQKSELVLRPGFLDKKEIRPLSPITKEMLEVYEKTSDSEIRTQSKIPEELVDDINSKGDVLVKSISSVISDKVKLPTNSPIIQSKELQKLDFKGPKFNLSYLDSKKKKTISLGAAETMLDILQDSQSKSSSLELLSQNTDQYSKQSHIELSETPLELSGSPPLIDLNNIPSALIEDKSLELDTSNQASKTSNHSKTKKKTKKFLK
ncbi:hypothetical protein ACR3K2_27400 [Cryptosporidium serpentis]